MTSRKCASGKPIDHSHDACVVPKAKPLPTTPKVKYAALAAVPVAIVVGAMLKAKKSDSKKDAGAGDEHSADNAAAPADGSPGEK